MTESWIRAAVQFRVEVQMCFDCSCETVPLRHFSVCFGIFISVFTLWLLRHTEPRSTARIFVKHLQITFIPICLKISGTKVKMPINRIVFWIFRQIWYSLLKPITVFYPPFCQILEPPFKMPISTAFSKRLVALTGKEARY